MNRATSHPRHQRRTASLLAALMFLGTIFPTGFASAQQFIAKPGAGVSRLPLNVTAFQADGFGDLTDAINLATGNVYLNVAGVSMNNFMDSGDDTSRAIGAEGWSLNARLRSKGFYKGLSSAPSGLFLGEGDGGGTPFERYTVSSYYNAPSWIERYKNVSNAYVYRNPEQDGVQYLEEFVVLLVRPNSSIAHYYDHSGTRYTFHDDGEFLDYVQDPHQQYRSAKAGYSEGREVKGEATILSYRNTSKGQLSKVQDPWGRVTRYTWNSDNTLRYVDELLQNESDPNSYVSRISFFYITRYNQRLMDKVFITRTNGLKQVRPYNHDMSGVDRRYLRFYYAQQSNGEILLNRYEKEGVNGTSNRSKTFYRYDPQNRVTRVHTTDNSGNRIETYTYYKYGTSSAFDGQQVTVQQGVKESVYEFDLSGQLRRKKVKDYNPRYSQTKWLTWNYTYGDESPRAYCRLCEASPDHPRGSTYRIEDPSGKATSYTYDKHGNVIEIYEAALENPTNDPSLNRTQIFDYDRDNRLKHEVMPPDSAKLEDGTTFAEYTFNRINHYYTMRPAVERNGQRFTAVQSVSRKRVGAGEDAEYTDTFDTYGRLTESKRVGEDQTQTTTYDYYYGTKNANWRQYLPDSEGQPSSSWTPVQYGDQVYLMTRTGEGTRSFTYDPYGNVVAESHTSGFSPEVGVTRSRTTYRSFNGFGQPVWELTFGGSDPKAADAQVAKRMWYYHAKTGNLDYSWEGNKKNVTTYTYAVNGTDNGRVTKIERGVSSSGNGTLSTVRGQTLFDYDEYGRVTEKAVDKHAVTNGFTTNYRYDTLDRVVEEKRPAEHGTTSRGLTGYKYDATGQISYTWNAGAGLQHFFDRDAFGRVTKEDWNTAAPIYTTYDPYDRPIAIRDERLTMNQAGEHRTRYFKYDLRGNLTHELGAPLRTAAGEYTDYRRPYVIHHYDGLNRKVKEQRLINGSTIVGKNNLIALSDSSSNVAVTEYSYDAANRLTQTTDPEDYITKYSYDRSGNLIKQVRQVCKTYQDSDCTSSVEGLATVDNLGYAVATYTGYDAANRLIWHKDARTNMRSTTYDLQGNVTKQINERDKETRRVYTRSGNNSCKFQRLS